MQLNPFLHTLKYDPPTFFVCSNGVFCSADRTGAGKDAIWGGSLCTGCRGHEFVGSRWRLVYCSTLLLGFNLYILSQCCLAPPVLHLDWLWLSPVKVPAFRDPVGGGHVMCQWGSKIVPLKGSADGRSAIEHRSGSDPGFVVREELKAM